MDFLQKDKLPEWEASLESHMASGEYDLELCHRIIKAYQFFPDQSKEAVIVNALAKALMATPAPDFSLLLCMIPDDMQLRDSVHLLTEMGNRLQTCDFKRFWAMCASPEGAALVGRCAGWTKAFQQYALQVIGMTYQAAPAAFVAEACGVDSVTPDLLPAGWKLEGDSVTIPVCGDNSYVPGAFDASTSLGDMSKVIRVLAGKQ
jgi:hypothetical protein